MSVASSQQARCECIAKVDAHLAAHNTKIELPMIGPQLPFVQTRKLNEKKRGKPAYMFASHCPFCGVKYRSEEDIVLTAGRAS